MWYKSIIFVGSMILGAMVYIGLAVAFVILAVNRFFFSVKEVDNTTYSKPPKGK